MFHKACSSLYNKQKLERKRKSLAAQPSEPEINNDESANNSEPASPPSKRAYRILNPISTTNLCLFCEREENLSDLHQVQTFRLNNRIKAIALEMEDHRLLSKLHNGDLIATEAKYHLKCLVDLKNRHRSLCNTKYEDKEQKLVEGMLEL